VATLNSAQLSVRKEVQEFILAAERLLSPVLRGTDLTPEECRIICEYLTTMASGNHPWSSHFTSTLGTEDPTIHSTNRDDTL
jgi:hypothetical protein